MKNILLSCALTAGIAVIVLVSTSGCLRIDAAPPSGRQYISPNVTSSEFVVSPNSTEMWTYRPRKQRFPVQSTTRSGAMTATASRELHQLLQKRVAIAEEYLNSANAMHQAGTLSVGQGTLLDAKIRLEARRIELYVETGDREKALNALEQKTAFAREQYERTQAAYKTGTTTLNELLDAEDAAVKAEIEYVQYKNNAEPK